MEAGGQRYQINIALLDSSDNFLIGADFGFVKAFDHLLERFGCVCYSFIFIIIMNHNV